MLALTYFAMVVLAIVCLFVVDDLFVDTLSWLFKLHPIEIDEELEEEMRVQPEKSIAIIVANWHEADVIGRMIAGNNRRLEYANHHFFLGVYPNDTETLAVARESAERFENVHVVVNSLEGPTSKGQMLNEIVRGILVHERVSGVRFDTFLMQDSEDVLHPRSLTVINYEMNRTDFLQTPVFSMDRPIKEWTGSTYIEEFAELHTKDLFVRQHLGAAIPSAGVGTAISRRLMLHLIANEDHSFLDEASLTEDYVLGLGSAVAGFESAFCCYYYEDEEGRRDFVATREYFPGKFEASVKQKSRWVIGIALQGFAMIPWSGSIWNRYFLYRDRRGPFNNFTAMCCTVLTAYLLVYHYVVGRDLPFLHEKWFLLGSLIATIGAISRVFHRVLCTSRVVGWKKCWFAILRWPLGNLINCLATIRAVKQYAHHRWTGIPLKWAKTSHELPEGFGDESGALPEEGRPPEADL